MSKRKLKLAVVSDIHLGTYGCQAKEVNAYLKSIEPEILILNGDIIDIWQFSKSYWPKSHTKVIQRIFKLMASGTKIYYLTGNHDEMLRKFCDFELGNLKILNKLVLELDGKKAWFFHGDVFDITMKHSKWLAKLGAVGYDTLIIINAAVNWISDKLGRGKISLSKKVKNSVKQAIKFIDDFEQTAMDIGLSKGYDYVVCGHIHHPSIKKYANELGEALYLNSGDWIENLSALEYNEGNWRLHFHKVSEDNDATSIEDDEEMPDTIPSMENIYLSVIENVVGNSKS